MDMLDCSTGLMENLSLSQRKLLQVWTKMLEIRWRPRAQYPAADYMID